MRGSSAEADRLKPVPTGSRRCWRVCALVLALLSAANRGSSQELNAGKYGAMFSWWYDRLPAATKYPPTIRWNAADSGWWTNVVKQAREAGLGWLAAASWGDPSNADPATLAPLVAAIDRAAPGIKIALFDDTASEVLRKNLARGYGWNLDTPFDLADLAGSGEGGLRFFYDHQWKRYFETVPPTHWLTVDGRPVVFMWHGGYAFYSRTNFFHELIDALRAATQRDFGVDPFIIVEESWLVLDPATRADAVYDWFGAASSSATVMTHNGFRVGHVVPGYDCTSCDPPSPYILNRQNGDLYRAGLQAVAPESDLVLIEGLTNVDENAHLLETSTWGKLYLLITRWFATNLP